MCEAAVISRNVVNLGKRTFNHRLEAVVPNGYKMSQLRRLNSDLDSLYELIYDDWRSISEEEYSVFGAQFKILIDTVKDLYDSCKVNKCFEQEAERLRMNYSALYELNSDIRRNCITFKNDLEFVNLFHSAAEATRQFTR